MVLDSELRIDVTSASLEIYGKAVQETRSVLQKFYQLSNELLNHRVAKFRLPPWMREETEEGLIVFDPGSRIKPAILLNTDGSLYSAQWNISINTKEKEALTGIEYLIVAKRQLEIIINYKPPTVKNNNIPS